MFKCRKKPVEVEYIEFTKWEDFPELPGCIAQPVECDDVFSTCKECGHNMGDHINIKTLEGWHIACPGDMIIKGVKGEYYPCKSDIFWMTYEKVDS